MWANYSTAHTGVIMALRTSADGEPPAYSISMPDLGVANGNATYGITAGDLDGDGSDDLVAGPSGSAHLLHGNGDGTFTASSCSMGIVREPQVHDVNGDGALDLVYRDGSSSVVVRLVQ